MSERMDDVIGHLLFAIDLLQEEVAHAPDTNSAARAAGYLKDIHFTLWQIERDQ